MNRNRYGSRSTGLRGRRAFTLIEVALSLAILIVGLTAVVSVYMISLRWIEETRVQLTALQTGRAVLADAGILMDRNDISKGLSNLDQEARGWLNDYYIVRTLDTTKTMILPKNAGTYVFVRIKVYYGGTDVDGEKSHEFTGEQIILKEYNP